MRLLLLALAVALSATLGLARAARSEPVPVASVDLHRYVGEWRELAAIPNFFERKCAWDTTAHYTDLGNGQLQIDNRCVKANEEISRSVGRARVVPGSGNARLEVSFFKLLGDYRFWFPGDYWVLALADDYNWVLVGTPNRSYGWLLSRKDILGADERAAAKAAMKAQGYDACEFMTTRQSSGRGQRMPYCEVKVPE